tara:strand:- start:9167 stop:9313 length:147 start_codon:yes stop_codon:yes gene_type:complete
MFFRAMIGKIRSDGDPKSKPRVEKIAFELARPKGLGRKPPEINGSRFV